MLTEISQTLKFDKVNSQIHTLVHNNSFMYIHENVNTMIMVLSFETVSKVHFQSF